MPGPTLYLANPRSFCAGVVRAIDIVRMVIKAFGTPIYVRHEIVHNSGVVEDLDRAGAIFVDDLESVPSGSTLIFSAHGVAPIVRREAVARNLRVIDATCPLVAKVHIQVMKYAADGYTIILIGHRNHVEVIGTFGEAPGAIRIVETIDDIPSLPNTIEKVAYVTQTTLSVDDTREIIAALTIRYPHIVAPAHEDICYATTNRQDAVKQLAKLCPVIIVVSSPTSSNGTRLVEVAKAAGCQAFMVDTPDQLYTLDRELLAGDIGITAAASTPESTVQACVRQICEFAGHEVVELDGIVEMTRFPLPPDLRSLSAAKTKHN